MPVRERSTQDWQAADAAHFMHPFTDHQALAAANGGAGVRIIERADSVYVWDSEGQQLLDAMSGLWCVNVGYGQRALIDAATQQLSDLPFYNAFFNTATKPALQLAEELAELAPPGLYRVFYTNSGSEAVDTAVRMVRRYWQIAGQPQRQFIIGRRHGFHGSTVAGAGLSGIGVMHAQSGLPFPGVTHIESPHTFELAFANESPEAFGKRAAGWLEQCIQVLGADKIAAFIGEPVQGAGGVIVPPASYWPEIGRICRQHGVLLISDEVICGFGRTGHWFGCQHFGVTPDLIAFAKGVTSGYVPLGGVLMGERVANALMDRPEAFEHGFTYSGHPTACAVALANLQRIRELDLLERVRTDLGPYLAAGLATLAEHPLVGEVQSCGLLASLQLVQDKAARKTYAAERRVGARCRDHGMSLGLITRAVSDRIIVAPPLVMMHAQIDEMLALLHRSLDLTLEDLRLAKL